MRWHIVGDSHIKSIRKAAQMGLLDWAAGMQVVEGATAVGLRNPNSVTDALNIFRSALIPAAPKTIPVIQLGEVDCGFVIWYRAMKYRESVSAQMAESLAAYFEFVDELLADGYENVVVTSPILPTIRDGQDWGDVANARREVTATLRDRTCLTIEYAEGLRRGAAARGQPFIDFSGDLLDPATGVLNEAFRHPNPADHHLHPAKSAQLWASHLNRLSRTHFSSLGGRALMALRACIKRPANL